MKKTVDRVPKGQRGIKLIVKTEQVILFNISPYWLNNAGMYQVITNMY